MDPGLHVKQALNHLQKVLAYAPYVTEDGPDGPQATVALTPEDWGVVADALFHMGTPRDVFPDAIADYALTPDGREIVLTSAEGTTIRIEAG